MLLLLLWLLALEVELLSSLLPVGEECGGGSGGSGGTTGVWGNNDVTTGSEGSSGEAEISLVCARAERSVSADAAACVEWVCQGEERVPAAAGVLPATDAGTTDVAVFCLVDAVGRGGLPLPRPRVARITCAMSGEESRGS